MMIVISFLNKIAKDTGNGLNEVLVEVYDQNENKFYTKNEIKWHGIYFYINYKIKFKMQLKDYSQKIKVEIRLRTKQ